MRAEQELRMFLGGRVNLLASVHSYSGQPLPSDLSTENHISWLLSSGQLLLRENQPNLNFFSNTGLFQGSLWVLLSSVTQFCPTLCDPMDNSTPGLPVHHQLPELAQTHVHRVGDAIQPSHPLSPSSPAFSLSQHQGLIQRVSSSNQVAKVLALQLQHQSFQ